MYYTERERKTMARAFRSAKARLRAHGASLYICNALPDSYIGDMARDEIMRRLRPFASASQWLFNRDIYPSDDEMFIYRKRWLDALIKEFEQ